MCVVCVCVHVCVRVCVCVEMFKFVKIAIPVYACRDGYIMASSQHIIVYIMYVAIDCILCNNYQARTHDITLTMVG